MEANEEAGVEVMETTVLPLILLVEVAVVAEEECKKFQKNSRQKSPAIDNYHIGFHEMDNNKNKKLSSSNFI